MNFITPRYKNTRTYPLNQRELEIQHKREGVRVSSYRELVEKIAQISYLNKEYLMFFRGQSIDYRTTGDTSSFYPTIYRGNFYNKFELKYRFRKLDSAAKLLVEELSTQDLLGFHEVQRREEVQWAILQHYEVTKTPLIDVTQSLRVACSFAQMSEESEYPDVYVYVFGLPYMHGGITTSSAEYLYYVRLLGIVPSISFRPLFQEGFVVGTENITDDYGNDKSQLDLNNRLIAKYIIPNNSDFWGDGFSKVPQNALYPKDDDLARICNKVKGRILSTVSNEDTGEFLRIWNEIENLVVLNAVKISDKRVMSMNMAIETLSKNNRKFAKYKTQMDVWRKTRDKLVENIVNDKQTQNGINVQDLKLLHKKIQKIL